MNWVGFAIAFAVGIGVGAIYGVLNVKSPAPPVIALVGLLGILLGESAVAFARGHPRTLSDAMHRKAFDVAAPTAARQPDREKTL